MKRFLCSLLLFSCLLTGLMQPVFGTEYEQPESESTVPQSEPTELTDIVELPEQTADEEAEAVPSQARTLQTLTTSEEGIAFVNEMMGGSYGGTDQLANAEYIVNTFCSTHGISISQQQFDALVDIVMQYGNILTEPYSWWKVIVSGSYTDAALATAFCAWVKGSDGSLSQQRLNRRLREIKLFLYGSYSGVCDAAFRYVIFNGNGGTLDDNTVICYGYGGTYAALPTASRTGYYFAGWYTAASGGTHLCNSDAVTQNHTVYAHWSETAVENPNEAGATDPTLPDEPLIPPELKTSEAGVQFIKDHEGFLQYAVWDYSQYSIGYGSVCDPADYPNGITEEEADYLLRVMLADFEKVVDKLLEKSTVEHTQAQYDAIISFTYNLGQQWMSDKYMIYQYFLNGGYDEMSFVNTIGSWCKAGGSFVSGLARRRMDEANLYLNGDYTLGTKRYLCISFNGAKGEPEYAFHYYMTGAPLGTLPTASREGYKLLGWYDKVAGGTQYTAQTIAPSFGTYTLYAQWEVSEETAPEPTPEPTPEPIPEPTPEPPQHFTDVPTGMWYYEWVIRATELGLFDGVSETEFAPESYMTRAMLVTVLYRMDGSPAVNTEAPFTDVAAGRWYSDAVNWAYASGIVNGISETQFGLNQNITREQLTTMLYRYADYLGCDISTLASLDSFSDASAVSNYARVPMQWAAANAIVSGDNGKLLPGGSATRAQCAKMVSVFYDTFLVTD